WWPDGSALLLRHLVEGRHRLLRFELGTGELQTIPTEPGVIWNARVRPDGRVWFLHEQGHRQRRVLDDTGAEVLELHGVPSPAARPYESWHFKNPRGDRVHGFFATPGDSGGPFPVVMYVHGGPTWLDMDRWQPEVSAYDDESPLLQAYDRALLGGRTPSDVPELMRERNPINFVDDVRAPVFFMIGENDSRCPYRQAMNYVEKLAARDHPHELYVFST